MSLMKLAGRALGALAGTITSVVWVYVIWFPSSGLTLSGMSVLVAGLMALLAIVGVIAAMKGHSTVLFVVFIASFLPIGAYLLGVNHWLRGVGVLNVLILVAVLMIRLSARARKSST
ncbi:MAG TPA: hypothetical protein VIM81_07840 [Gammaproteobacteria bacterium]